MTEAKQSKYEIIPRDFNGKEIDFINKEEDIWITAETVGIGLEYNSPRKSIMNLYSAHRDEIEIYSSVIDLMTEAGMRKTTVFSEMGAYLLIMFSNQPKAKEFRKWVVNVIKEIRKTGIYIKKVADPYDLMVQQADMIKNAFIELKNQNKKLSLLENHVLSVDSELKEFEQKYDDERIITPQTRKKIKDLIHECVKNSGMHWNNFWPKIWNTFGITTTTDISEKLGQKIIKWIKIYPFFKQFLNENKEVEKN